MQNVQLNVQGMSCSHCVRSIEGAVKNIGASATVDLATNTVDIVYDESNIALNAIVEAIEEQGYDVV